jgi:hypothetical protein
MKMKQHINVGDHVAFCAQFLRDTGQITGKVPFARGVVMSIIDGWLAVVFWQESLRGTGTVHVDNLAVVGTPAMSIN